MPNATGPVNGAAENIHHGLAFLLVDVAGRAGEAKAGVRSKCWHCRAQVLHSPIQFGTPNANIYLGVPTQGPKLCVTQYTFSTISAFRISSKCLMDTVCLVLKETYRHLRILTGIYQVGLERGNYNH